MYDVSDPWLQLACAVLVQAAKDARGRSVKLRDDARLFLASEGAADLALLLGADPEHLRRVCFVTQPNLAR